MKIVITNTVSLNTGDAAILKGIIKILHGAFGRDFELVVFDSHHNIARQLYQEIEFRNLVYNDLFEYKTNIFLRRILKLFNLSRFQVGLWALKNRIDFIYKTILPPTITDSVNIYKDADLVISTGGTYLVENYSLEPRIFELNIAVRLKKPLLFFTQSLGPFNKHRNRKFIKQIFNNAFLIFLRDNRSKDNLISIGVKKRKCHVTADAAFALSDKSRIEKAKVTDVNFIKPSIAISVRDWRKFEKSDSELGMANYLDAVKETCIYLSKKYDARITFLSTCQGIEEYWADDSKIAREVFNMIPGEYRESIDIVNCHHSPEQLMHELTNYDFVISTRLHMSIMSLNVGVPVIPIAYEFKTKELFIRLGQEKYINDIEDISSDGLVKTIDSFIEEINSNKTELFNRVESEIEQAVSNSDLIKQKYDCLKSASIN